MAIASFATNLMWTTIDWLFSGQLQKHPKLQISLAEGGIGWIPYILERCDQTWEKHRWYQKIDFDTRPSGLFATHFWGCFIEDTFGVANRYAIGVDRICIEIDYLREGHFGSPLHVRSRFARVGRTSAVEEQAAWQHDSCVALAEVTIVHIIGGRPEPVTYALRAVLSSTRT